MQSSFAPQELFACGLCREPRFDAGRLQRSGNRCGRANLWPQAHTGRAGKIADTDRQRRQGHWLARRRQAGCGRRNGGQRVCHRARSSSNGVCPAQRRCAGSRDRRTAERPGENRGIKGWITKLVMGRAGAGTTSANRITLLRDADGDGIAETRSVFLEGLNSPFGMALVGNDFYVADSDAIVKFPYHTGDTKITAAGIKLADLPGGPLNHHWTKDLVASPRRDEALCDRRLQQQCRRQRHGGRNQSRRRARSRSRDRCMARVRVGPSQSERACVAAAKRRAVGGRQRARRTRQRSRARLHDVGEGRRLLWLALQLLRPACRCPRPAAAARSGCEGDRAGLRARRAHRFAWA